MTPTIRFVSIGDCCADIYGNRVVLGGTAYNVAVAARKAGASISIVSAVGNDIIGKRFLKSFQDADIDTSHLSIRPAKTSSIPIHLDGRGRPIYGTWSLNAMQNFHLSSSIAQFLQNHDAVRAVMFTPIAGLFREFCDLELGTPLKIGDFAGSSSDSINVYAIERYASRLDIIIKSIEESSATSLEILKSIAQKYNSMVLALLGSRGSTVFFKGKTYHEHAQNVTIKNTTGAGDTYQGYFLVEYLRTHDIQRSMHEATNAAAEFIRLNH